MLRSLTKPVSGKRGALIFVKAEKEHEGIEDMPPAEGGDFLHILHGGSEEALLGNLRKPPHTAITEAM